MELYRVIAGKYQNRLGTYDKAHRMFYPIEGKHPYRVCLTENQIRKELTK